MFFLASIILPQIFLVPKTKQIEKVDFYLSLGNEFHILVVFVFIEAFIFMFILIVGLVYAWPKGDAISKIQKKQQTHLFALLLSVSY